MESANPRLENILRGLIQEHGWQRAEWLSTIDRVWSDIVGEAIHRHTQIITLTTDGLLIVAVPSSVWAQELLYYKPRLLHELHIVLGPGRVKDIRTRVRASAPVQTVKGGDGIRSPYFPAETFVGTTEDVHELLARVEEKYQQAARVWLDGGMHPCVNCGAPTQQGYQLCVVCDLMRFKSGE